MTPEFVEQRWGRQGPTHLRALACCELFAHTAPRKGSELSNLEHHAFCLPQFLASEASLVCKEDFLATLAGCERPPQYGLCAKIISSNKNVGGNCLDSSARGISVSGDSTRCAVVLRSETGVHWHNSSAVQHFFSMA